MSMKWCAMSHTIEHSGYPQVNRCTHHVLQWDQPTTPLKDAIKNALTSCRAYGIMHMMCCFRGQSSVSQMNFLLHDSIWLQSMGSNPSASCRTYELMRINECVVEEKTVQHPSKFFHVIHYSFTSLAAFYCPLVDNPQIFVQSWIDIRLWFSCFAWK